MSQQQALKIYIEEAKRLRGEYVLEEQEILQKIKEGDDSLRYRLVEGNLLLVIKIAHDYKNHGIQFWDIVSEGNYALLNAAMLFDAKVGSKFSSYMGMAVRRRIHAALATANTLIKTANTGGIQNAKKVRLWASDYESCNGTEPSMETIQNEFPNYSMHQIRNYLFSLIDKVTDGKEWEIIKNIAVCTPEVSHSFRRQELWTYLEKLMEEKLDERTIRIIKMRVGIECDPMSLAGVTKHFNLTRERIRQIYWDGLRELRRHVDPALLGHIKFKQNIEENTHGIFT